jgi:hypothetical protein
LRVPPEERLTTTRSLRIAAAAISLFCSTSVHAGLHAVGHEFRPTLAERKAPDSCLGADGTRASIRFACLKKNGQEVWGRCDWDRVPVAEWHDGNGDRVAGPYLVQDRVEEDLQFACNGDTMLVTYVTHSYSQFRTVARDGTLSAPQRLINSSAYPIVYPKLASLRDGWFLLWTESYTRIRGRYVSKTGSPKGDTIEIQDWENVPGLEQIAVQADDDDRLLVAWSLRDNQRWTQTVYATLLEGFDVAEPEIVVSEFPHLYYGLLSITSQAPGRFVVAWENQLQSGWVARRVIDDDGTTTTTTTTTTTLAPDVPEFVTTRVLAEMPTGEFGDPAFRRSPMATIHRRWAKLEPDRRTACATTRRRLLRRRECSGR